MRGQRRGGSCGRREEGRPPGEFLRVGQPPSGCEPRSTHCLPIRTARRYPPHRRRARRGFPATREETQGRLDAQSKRGTVREASGQAGPVASSGAHHRKRFPQSTAPVPGRPSPLRRSNSDRRRHHPSHVQGLRSRVPRPSRDRRHRRKPALQDPGRVEDIRHPAPSALPPPLIERPVGTLRERHGQEGLDVDRQVRTGQTGRKPRTCHLWAKSP